MSRERGKFQGILTFNLERDVLDDGLGVAGLHEALVVAGVVPRRVVHYEEHASAVLPVVHVQPLPLSSSRGYKFVWLHSLLRVTGLIGKSLLAHTPAAI